MLFTEKTTVCCKNHTKHLYTLHRKKFSIYNVRASCAKLDSLACNTKRNLTETASRTKPDLTETVTANLLA
jgi:hypothetical protein